MNCIVHGERSEKEEWAARGGSVFARKRFVVYKGSEMSRSEYGQERTTSSLNWTL